MRRYRTHKWFWGFGISKSPGGWYIQFWRWVFTTEPE